MSRTPAEPAWAGDLLAGWERERPPIAAALERPPWSRRKRRTKTKRKRSRVGQRRRRRRRGAARQCVVAGPARVVRPPPTSGLHPRVPPRDPRRRRGLLWEVATSGFVLSSLGGRGVGRARKGTFLTHARTHAVEMGAYAALSHIHTLTMARKDEEHADTYVDSLSHI